MTEMIQVPASFKYKDILFLGRPIHDRHSAFYAQHPPMPASRWAKIYAPFDALRGFNECIAEQEIVRRERRELDEDAQKELDRRLEILKNLTWNNRMAKANQVRVIVTFYQPDTSLYETITGIIWKVDTEISGTIKAGHKQIEIKDILKIEADGIFDRDWELESSYCDGMLPNSYGKTLEEVDDFDKI